MNHPELQQELPRALLDEDQKRNTSNTRNTNTSSTSNTNTIISSTTNYISSTTKLGRTNKRRHRRSFPAVQRTGRPYSLVYLLGLLFSAVFVFVSLPISISVSMMQTATRTSSRVWCCSAFVAAPVARNKRTNTNTIRAATAGANLLLAATRKGSVVVGSSSKRTFGTATTELASFRMPAHNRATSTVRSRTRTPFSFSSLSALPLASSEDSDTASDSDTTSDTHSTTSNNNEISTTTPPNERAVLLNTCLDKILSHPTTTTTTTTRVDADGSNNNNDDNRGKTTTPSVELMDAALRSLRDPSNGYDQRYGRPALRAYRSFVYPKQKQEAPALAVATTTGRLGTAQSSDMDSDTDGDDTANNTANTIDIVVREDPIQFEAAAQRTARQIDFLVKRHTSKRLEAIRNHDPGTPGVGDGTSTTSAGSAAANQPPRNRNRKHFPITLVLDNLRGSFNVGSIFRTSEACGVKEILTCGITPHPNGSGAEKVAKSALGADLLVPSRHFDTTRRALLDAKKATNNNDGGNGNNSNNNNDTVLPPLVVALETTAVSQLYTGFDYRPYYRKSGSSSDDSNNDDRNSTSNGRGIVLILGNEVTGVDAELMAHLLLPSTLSSSENENGNNENENGKTKTNTETITTTGLVDAIVELPTYGQKNSLNVAAVAPVILYEILRQWEEEE